MKRVIAAVSLTIAGLAALLGYRTREMTGTPGTTTSGSTTTSTTASGGITTTSAAAVQTDGPVVSTRYGPVQVAVTVADGVLVDVVALQLPSGDRESDQISSNAAPLLREMALQAQSASIDVVSGATSTSRAYADSLQAALDEAGM